MANGHQMEHLIREATHRVAEQGGNADLSDQMLAGFGYLAHEINKPQWWALKRVLPAAFGIGATAGAGLVAGILKFLGGGGP